MRTVEICERNTFMQRTRTSCAGLCNKEWVNWQAKSAYHLNEIFGENVSTNGTARSVLRKRKWEYAVPFAKKTGCSR